MTTDAAPLQSFSVPATADRRRQAALWAGAVSPFYALDRLDGPAPCGSFTAWRLARSFFTDTRFSAQGFRRGQRQWARDEFGYLSVQLYLSGTARGVADGQAFRKSPGALHLFDFSRPFHSVASEARVFGAIVPHTLVGYDPARQPAHLLLREDDSVGHVMIHAFRALMERLPAARRDEAAGLEAAFAGLLRGALLPGAAATAGAADPVAGEAFSAARERAVRDYIERHLHHPRLRVDDVCAAFRLSPATVYRMFEPEGGFRGMLRGRRLERARAALTRMPASPGQVTRMAERCGFASVHSFGRAFRSRFGVSPGAAMARAGDGGAEGFRAWLSPGGRSGPAPAGPPHSN